MRRYIDRVRYHMTNFAIGLTIVFVISILHSTYFEHEPPVNIKYSKMELNRVDIDHGFLTLYKTVEVQRAVAIRISGFISKHPQGQPIFLIEPFETALEAGPKDSIRVITLPAHLPKGTWCLNSTMYWHPKLSLHEHSIRLPVICAELRS